MFRLTDSKMAWFMAFVAITAGALVNYGLERMIGVRLELFWGVSTFSPTWILTVFVLPFIAGFVVSMVYGLGGKLLCYFAPLIPRIISYIQMNNYSDMPEGVTVLPIYYWILIVILVVEAAAFGGVAGEIMMKKTYGRRPRHTLYKRKADKQQPSESES